MYCSCKSQRNAHCINFQKKLFHSRKFIIYNIIIVDKSFACFNLEGLFTIKSPTEKNVMKITECCFIMCMDNQIF